MSTYSSLKFELILTGDQSGQWGNTTNTNIGTAINEAIAGSVDITFASADLTLTLTDTNAAQSARNLRLNLTGTAGGAARTLTLGSGCNINKPYIVNNNLSDAVTVTRLGGAGISVPAGKTMWLFNNGTNVVDVVSHLSSLTLVTALPVTSGGTGATTSTGAGAVVLATSPTLVTPVLGTPASGNFSTGTFTWPTFNQNTTGYAAGIAGGVANKILYQSGVNATTFIDAPTTASTYLSWNGSAFVWNAGTTTSTFVTDISINGVTAGRGNGNSTTNTCFGSTAMGSASGLYLTAIGVQALAGNTGGYCTAVGYQAIGAVANSGTNHVGVGYQALYNLNNASATGNTAMGYRAGYGMSSGNSSTYIGKSSGFNQRGTANTAVGYETCGSIYSLGTYYDGGANTYIGGQAGASNRTGGYNTGVGLSSLYTLTVASSNVAMGAGTLYYFNDTVTANTYNTALGYNAGNTLLSGANNTLLGYNAQASTTTASNEFVLGNSSVSVLRCQQSSISGLSDARDKYDIEDLPVGLDFINSLKARRFKWDKRDAYFDEVQNETGPPTQVAVPKDGSRKSDEWNEGFIAQEVDEAATAAGADWMKIVYKSNPEKLEMAPGKLIPVLVKAIQELTARLEALEARN